MKKYRFVRKFTIGVTVLAMLLSLTAGAGIVFAEGEVSPCVCEQQCAEDAVNGDCAVCAADFADCMAVTEGEAQADVGVSEVMSLFGGGEASVMYTGAEESGAEITPMAQVTTELDFRTTTVTNDVDGRADGYYWDYNNKTLTLSGLDLIVTGSTPAQSAAIRLPADAIIELTEGSINTIVCAYDGTASTYGIMALGSLTIRGTGSLTVTGGTTSGGTSYGINTSNMTMDGGTITLTGGNGPVSYGLYVNGTVVINEGKLSANGGAGAVSSNGITTTLGITVNGSSEVYARGATYALSTVTEVEPDAKAVGNNNSSSDEDLVTWDIDRYVVQGTGGDATYVKLTAQPFGLIFKDGSNGWSLYKSTDDSEYTEQAGKWSASANTLSLFGFTFIGEVGIVLDLPEDTTIKLSGDNTISGGDANVGSTVISSMGNLVIENASGSQGTLSLTADDSDGVTTGIFSMGDITIRTKVNAISGASATLQSYGINTAESLIVANDADIIAVGGASPSTSNGSSFGILCGDLTMSGGSINVTSGDSPSTSMGLAAGSGTLTGGKIMAQSGAADRTMAMFFGSEPTGNFFVIGGNAAGATESLTYNAGTRSYELNGTPATYAVLTFELPVDPTPPPGGTGTTGSGSPQTGDTSNFNLWIALCLIAGATLYILLRHRRQRTEQ